MCGDFTRCIDSCNDLYIELFDQAPWFIISWIDTLGYTFMECQRGRAWWEFGPQGQRGDLILENFYLGKELDLNQTHSPCRVNLPPPFHTLNTCLQYVSLLLKQLTRYINEDHHIIIGVKKDLQGNYCHMQDCMDT